MQTREVIRFCLFRLVILGCVVLPPRFLYWIALRMGDLAYFLLDPKGRAAVKQNLRHVFPHAAGDRIRYEARWVFRNFGKYLTEFFRFRRFDRDFFARHVNFRGIDKIEEQLAKGNGCLIVSAHISNWELGAAGMVQRYGPRVSVVAAMHPTDFVNDLFLRERKAMGIKVIDMKYAPRLVIKALKNNEIVCILGDRDVTDQGLKVNFFDKPCKFPQGPWRFATKLGIGIIPGAVHRRSNDSFVVHFHPPIYTPEEGSREEKMQAMAQEYAGIMEATIRDHPEEWGAFYNVWDEKWT